MREIPDGLAEKMPRHAVEKIDRLLATAGAANSSAASVAALTIVMLDIAESLRELNGYVRHSSWDAPTEQEPRND